MATFYILYSSSLNKFYVGSCKDLVQRVGQHVSKFFPGAFTSKAKDWVVYLQRDELSYVQARKIELHVKKMKSKTYFQSLKSYPELLEKLVALYKE